MGLSKKQKANAERLQAALADADEQKDLEDAVKLANAVNDGDEKKADEIAGKLKKRGVY